MSVTAPATEANHPKPHRTRRRGLSRSRPAIMLVAGQIALGLVIAIVSGFLVAHLRAHTILMADHEQRRLAMILANQAERSFEAVELVQSALMERLDRKSVV